MIDLAIPDDFCGHTTIIETNNGRRMRAKAWPGDYEFQIVAFAPAGTVCEVVRAGAIAEDIAMAIEELTKRGGMQGRKPDWYRRLEQYARGADPKRKPVQL